MRARPAWLLVARAALSSSIDPCTRALASGAYATLLLHGLADVGVWSLFAIATVHQMAVHAQQAACFDPTPRVDQNGMVVQHAC